MSFWDSSNHSVAPCALGWHSVIQKVTTSTGGQLILAKCFLPDPLTIDIRIDCTLLLANITRTRPLVKHMMMEGSPNNNHNSNIVMINRFIYIDCSKSKVIYKSAKEKRHYRIKHYRIIPNSVHQYLWFLQKWTLKLSLVCLCIVCDEGFMNCTRSLIFSMKQWMSCSFWHSLISSYTDILSLQRNSRSSVFPHISY